MFSKIVRASKLAKQRMRYWKKRQRKNFLIQGELTETNTALLFFSELSRVVI